MRKKVIGIVAAAVLAVLAVSGCGAGYSAAHDHNAPTATNSPLSTSLHWHWLDSPGNFQTIIYACVGTEGFYETQDNQYPFLVIPQDPLCGFTGPRTIIPAR